MVWHPDAKRCKLREFIGNIERQGAVFFLGDGNNKMLFHPEIDFFSGTIKIGPYVNIESDRWPELSAYLVSHGQWFWMTRGDDGFFKINATLIAELLQNGNLEIELVVIPDLPRK